MTGSSASSHRRRLRPAAGRCVLALTAAVVAVTGAAPAGVVGAQTETPASPGPPVRTRLVAQSPWVGADDDWEMTIATDALPPETELAVTIHQRLRSRSLFHLSLEGELGSVLWTDARPVEELGRTPAGELFVSIPLSSGPGRRIRTEGVYPVHVELRAADGTVLSAFVTHLIRVYDDPDVPPLSTALVIPFGAPPALAPDGTVSVDDATRARLTTIANALATHPRVAATLAPTPETIDALQNTGVTEDAAIVSTLRRSLDGRQVLARPYVTLDAPAMLDAGMRDEVALQLRVGRDIVAAALAPARPDVRTWIGGPGLDGRHLPAIRDLGVDHLVVAERHLTPTDLPTTLLRPTELSSGGVRVPAVGMSDDRLAARLDPRTDAVHATDPVLAAHQVVAELAQLHLDAPALERGVLLAAPDGWAPDPAFLDALLAALGDSPFLRPVTVDEWFELPVETDEDGNPLARSLVPEPIRTLSRFAQELADHRRRLAGYASMLEPGDLSIVGAGQRLLVASSAELDAGQRNAYLNAVRDQIISGVAPLELPAEGSITLTSHEAEIPVTIRSSATLPLDVQVTLSSTKLDFPDGPSQTVTVTSPATTVTFAVKALASGTFPVDVRLTSPDGALPIAAQRLTVRSTAVSGVGIVLTIGAGLFLVLWWAKHLHKTRRSRRLIALDASDQL